MIRLGDIIRLQLFDVFLDSQAGLTRKDPVISISRRASATLVDLPCVDLQKTIYHTRV
jgi:hypothetical protein